MSADIFSKFDCLNLLSCKRIYMFGDSNMRAIYKDLLWLLEEGTLIPKRCLKKKNESSHAHDVNVSNGKMTSSRNYVEVRQYERNCFIRYEFITKLYSEDFVTTIMQNLPPDFIIINSCLWDLSRWGPDGVRLFKENLRYTFQFLYMYCPKTRVIWTTTLPPSFKARGGFLTEELDFLKDLLPLQVIEANHYAVGIAKEYEIDVVDLHYYLRYLIDFRSLDGIHWEPAALRYITNILLTHIAMCDFRRLPGNCQILYEYAFSTNVNNHGNVSGVRTRSNKSKKKRNKNRRWRMKNRDFKGYESYDFSSFLLNFKFAKYDPKATPFCISSFNGPTSN